MQQSVLSHNSHDLLFSGAVSVELVYVLALLELKQGLYMQTYTFPLSRLLSEAQQVIVKYVTR